MLKAIIAYAREWTSNLWQIIRLRFKSSVEKDLEIIALRSQLALYKNRSDAKRLLNQNLPWHLDNSGFCFHYFILNGNL